MNPEIARQIITERRQLPGRSFEKEHSMDECLSKLFDVPDVVPAPIGAINHSGRDRKIKG